MPEADNSNPLDPAGFPAESSRDATGSRLQRAFSIETVGVIFFDGDGAFVDSNDAFLSMTGLTRAEIESGKLCWDDLTPDEWKERSRQALSELKAKGRTTPYEKEYLRKDGSRFWGLFAATKISENESVEYLIDITERKRAEKALREREEFVRSTLDSFTSMIAIVDDKGVIVDVNEAWKDFARENGYAKANYGVGENYLEVTRQAVDAGALDAEEVGRGIAAVLRGESSSFEFEYPCHPPGGFRWFMVNVSPLATANGGAVVWHTNITDRKRAEEQLRASEERFRQFAENSADMFWIVDAEVRRVEYLNPIFEKMWGASREPILRSIEKWSELVHPDDRERAASARPRVLAGESVAIEYRIVRPTDGAVRWIRDTAFPIRNEAGQVVRMAGVAQDVTEDKKRTEALGVTEERFHLLVEGAREYAMFLLDPGNIITYWSKGAERVFGWSAEEAVGQSGELVFTPEDRANEQEEKEIEIALRDGTAPDQRWHLRKDGTRIWVDGVMRRLEDEETGALRGFAKIARDATEQRHAEEQLRRAHDELEQRVRERTKELLQEMDRRQRLEREVLDVTERERERISQDLHDSLCQELTATAFLLKSRAKALATQSKAASDSLMEAAETVNKNAGLARDLARGLHSFELGSAGLPSALRELCSRTNESISCRCDCPRSLRLEQTMAINLYRIAQEAVTNSVKHAKANEIVISLDRTNSEIVLSVSDDGEGKRKRGRGLGTHIMEYRARAAGGTLQVESARGRGTTVTCRVPVKR